MRNGKSAALMFAVSLLTTVLITRWPFTAQLEVETAVIQQGELVQSVLLSGVVRYEAEQPYVPLRDGIISRVYVQAGQRICQGELLFKLDTSAEERTLAKIYETKHQFDLALSKMDEQTATLAAVGRQASLANENQLKAIIEASSIRAAADGIMDAVYVEEGQMVSAAEVLGMSHGNELQIAASAYTDLLTDVYPGATAIIRKEGCENALTLKKVSANETALRTFYFETADGQKLEQFLEPGENVTVEMITGTEPETALVPLGAVDEDEMIWVVDNGKAYHYGINLNKCNREYASTDLQWAGKTVILRPERYELQDGIAVQVRE